MKRKLLEDLPDNFGYLASVWEGEFEMPLIALKTSPSGINNRKDDPE